MAKQMAKRMDLPTVDEAAIERQEIASEQLAEKAAAVASMEVERRKIEVPLANAAFGYLPRRVDLRKLTGRQSHARRQLEEALASQGVRLRDGSRINCPGNAIKWLLESLASL